MTRSSSADSGLRKPARTGSRGAREARNARTSSRNATSSGVSVKPTVVPARRLAGERDLRVELRRAAGAAVGAEDERAVGALEDAVADRVRRDGRLRREREVLPIGGV